MNLNEQTFGTIFGLPFALRDHFDKTLQKMTATSTKSSQELTVYLKFIDNVYHIGLNFERSLFKACEEFQFSMKETVADERVANYFQHLINSLLRYGDVVHKVNQSFLDQKAAVSEFTRNTKSYQTNMGQLVTATTNEFRTSLQRYETDYRKYVRSQISYASAGPVKMEDPPSKKPNMIEVTEFLSSKKYEETAVKSSAELNLILDKNFECLKQKLHKLSLLELDNKKDIRLSVLSLLSSLKTIHTKEGCPTGNTFPNQDTFDDPNTEFRNEFKSLLREASLDFNQNISFANPDLGFVGYQNFLKLNFIFENATSRAVYAKLARLSPEISPRIKVYTDLFFSHFYLHSTEFSKEIIEELNILMANKRTREYFIYSMIMKKCTIFSVRPFAVVTLKREQFRNLQPISQYLFLNYLNLDDVDFELIYYFLKFASSIISEQKACFIETCLKIVVFYEVDFWRRLFDFVFECALIKVQEPKVTSRDPLDAQFTYGIKKLVKSLKNPINNDRQEVALKAFDEIVGLLFKLKLDFETITDILIVLSHRAEIGVEYVKTLLIRHQDILMSQISGQSLIQSEMRVNPTSRFKSLPQTQKLGKVLVKLVPFLSKSSDVLSCLLISKETAKLHRKMINKYLLTHHFPPDSRLRRQLLAIRNDKESRLLVLPNFPKDPNSIISLDVLRTFSQCPAFNSDAIERILNVISRPSYGGFSYYQGLNYVVTYFYVIFGGDEVVTYNFVISMINKDYAGYIDPELRNVKKLFYYLKKLLKNNLPNLQTYLENEHKIDTDIVFASWCLTLFTTVTQYTGQSSLLDEAIDIFLGEGWTGFFKVILVILDQMQEKLLKMSYEEILMTLSELAKSNFKDMDLCSKLSPNSPSDVKSAEDLTIPSGLTPAFSFKESIKRYKHIKKNTIIYYQMEFHQMMEKIDEIWFKIHRKIKTQGTSN